VEFKSLVGAS